MDLGKITVLSQDGAWLPINSPDGTLILEFFMVGRDSNECSLSVKQSQKKLREKNGQIDDDDNKRTVIACIKDWRDPDTAEIDPKTKKKDPATAKHLVKIGKEELVCNFANKKRVLDEFGFIYRQADGHIIDDSNFFKTVD